MGVHDLLVKKSGLDGYFASCAMPRLEDRMAAIAGNNQFLFFAERHNDIATLDVLSQPETLRALSAGGHRAIATEIFPVAYNNVFQGYFEGRYSEEAMRFAIENMSSNLSEDMGADAAAFMQRYADIAVEAKSQNMRLYGVGAGEGFYDVSGLPDVLAAHESLGQALGDALEIFDQTEGFADLSKKQQEEILRRELGERGWDQANIDMTVNALGGEEQSLVDDLNDDEQMVLLSTRLDQDYLVAGRLDEISREVGGGVTTIYGGFHVWRGGTGIDRGYGAIGGDLDESLGEDRTSVISVFTDSREFWQEFIPEVKGDLYEMGIRLENAGDYQIDMKNGRWYDGRTDTNCDITMPPGLQPAAAPPPSAGPETTVNLPERAVERVIPQGPQ